MLDISKIKNKKKRTSFPLVAYLGLPQVDLMNFRVEYFKPTKYERNQLCENYSQPIKKR